jgi:hypothetical protein
MLKNPKWTIASVNWDSLDFLEHQAKFFHTFDDNFEYIICDHTRPFQKEQLHELQKKYKNIRLHFPHDADKKYCEHGQGLNHCLKKARGKYFLTIDPDFFFMKKRILNFIEEFFKKKYHAVGTMFHDVRFPPIWGAAYITKEIKDLDLRSKPFNCNKCGNFQHNYLLDTGCEIRIRLKNKSNIAFESAGSKLPFFGSHLDGWNPNAFVYQNKIICYHLMRGSYNRKDPFATPEMIEARRKYTEYFWNNLYD